MISMEDSDNASKDSAIAVPVGRYEHVIVCLCAGDSIDTVSISGDQSGYSHRSAEQLL